MAHWPLRVASALSARWGCRAGCQATDASGAGVCSQPLCRCAHATSGTAPYVFFTAANGSVWQQTVGGGPETPVGGRLISGPSVIWAGGPTLFVFGQGTDHALWNTVCTAGGACSAWRSMGGVITSKPGAANIDSTYYSVYARGTNGAVQGRAHGPSGWGAWFTTGGQVRAGTGPDAVGRGTSYYVLVTGTNRALYVQQVTGSGASGFANAGGVTNSGPALVNTSSSLVGYARGTSNAGYYHRFLSTTPGWHSIGGILSSGMGGASWGSTPYGYGLGLSGEVYQNTGLAVGTGRR